MDIVWPLWGTCVLQTAGVNGVPDGTKSLVWPCAGGIIVLLVAPYLFAVAANAY